VTSQKESSRLQVPAWVLYDFANSVYSAVIPGTIFAVYFAGVIVGNDLGQGDLWWGRVGSVSALFVAMTSPLLGSIADSAGVRKKMLFLYTYVCIGAVSLFVTIEPGMVLRGFLLAVVANIGLEGALVYYNAYLPDLAPKGREGSLSALGFGVGYAGSIAGLLAALPLVMSGRYDLTWISVSALFALFSIPAFVFLPPDRAARQTLGQAAVSGLTGFRRIVGEVLAETQLRRFLLAFFFYINGVLTVIWFAGIFAGQTLGFANEEIIALFIVVQFSALVGALALARPTDRWGAKPVILLTLVLWTAVVIAAFFVQTKAAFFVVAVAAGFGLGTVQSASRCLMAQLIPPGKEAEMFGFYALCGKSSSILGPLIFGQVSSAFGGNQRIASLAVAGFFLAGLVLLRRVRLAPAGEVASRPSIALP
jgi:UMF1 family MFS transporter